jgi:hypothetical protein
MNQDIKSPKDLEKYIGRIVRTSFNQLPITEMIYEGFNGNEHRFIPKNEANDPSSHGITSYRVRDKDLMFPDSIIATDFGKTKTTTYLSDDTGFIDILNLRKNAK